MSSEPEMSVFHPDRAGIRQVLGDLEAEIMELVWARPAEQGTTVRDVFEVLYERRHLAYTTVQSTMNRLAKKRMLRAKTEEHAHIYFPVLTQEEFVSRMMGRVLEGLLSNFTGMTHEPREVSSDEHSAERACCLFEEIARRKTAQEEP
ncbi:MAG: BlaI/MecI/CopY family transcriptional regulator [Ktedonobacteraceae bacterium]